jgi:hypothetical protein
VDQLIEFIFSNLFFIILIVWFLSNVFRRRQAENDREGEGEGDVTTASDPRSGPASPRTNTETWPGTEPSPVDAGGPDIYRVPESERTSPQQDLPWETVSNDAANSQRHTANRHEQEMYMEHTEHVSKRYSSKLRSTVQHAERRYGGGSRKAANDLNEVQRMLALQADRRKRLEQYLDFRNMDRDKVVQGFVWSEIFGQPRSKRKHRSQAFQSNPVRRPHP